MVPPIVSNPVVCTAVRPAPVRFESESEHEMSSYFDTLAPEHIRSLPVYKPGKPLAELERELGITGAIKLASNENPMGPSPLAVAAAQKAAADMQLYPDGGGFALRRALSDRLQIAPDELVFGNGSNEIIHLIVQALCDRGRDEVLSHKYAFISYRLAAMAHGIPFVEAEVNDDLSCNVDALIAAITPRTKVIFLANPNNPTGAHLVTAQFERLVSSLPRRVTLVVDEAYHEYSVGHAEAGRADYPRSQGYRSAEMPQILTLRTFSKIYGLAGIRVGYGIGDSRLVGYLNRTRRPFNLNSIAQVAAVAALDDVEHLDRSYAASAASLSSMMHAAEELGIQAYPSLGNFVLLRLGPEALDIHRALLRRGVIVRPMAAWGLPEHIRVSVGQAEDTERFNATLAEVLASR